MIPPELLPVVIALGGGIASMFLQTWLNRRERESKRKANEAVQRDMVAETLRSDYLRIRQERDDCRQEVLALRRALRSNGIDYRKGDA